MPPINLSPPLASFVRQPGALLSLNPPRQPSRWASHSAALGSNQFVRAEKIPQPTPFVPDVATFLKVIGRGCSKHAAAFPSWEALFSTDSDQLHKAGIDIRKSRYILSWLKRFREGNYGAGGDMKHVTPDGVAHLRVMATLRESEAGGISKQKTVYNVPTGVRPEELRLEDLVRPRGYSCTHSKTVLGPYAKPAKGSGHAKVEVTEGMWEDKQGRKIDGGERRRAQVRFERGVAERKAAREAKGFA